MNFVELTNEEFSLYALNHPLGNYVQSVEFKILREALGSKSYLFGVKENDVIIAASFVYEIPTVMNKKIFYAPKGFLLDYNNCELLNFFTQSIIKYSKSRGGIKLIIDPEVIYQLRNNDGEIISETNNLVIDNLKKTGFEHFGFNKNFETLQVRFQAVLPLKNTYEETISTFSKSTRNNIIKTLSNGLKIRKASSIKDIEIMYELFNHTAENKHFKHRSLNYYKRLFELLPDIVTVYIVSLDFEEEKDLLESQIEETRGDLDKINLEMSKVNVGQKMLTKKEQTLNKLNKLNEKLSLNANNRNKYNSNLDISALLSIRSSKEYCCITSGMLEEFKEYGPKYAMYNAHIKDALEFGINRVNFCGISGVFEHSNPLYNIFELKKGFNGHVEEFIGEFSISYGMFGLLYKFVKNAKRG